MALPRVRIAPSPTGYFHVGGARTALYNWLYARQNGGQFILRIEDTDVERNREDWVGGIDDALRWLELEWDERYRQSERAALYADAAARLIASGHTYYCDCTSEVVAARTKGNSVPGYDGYCRDRGLGPGPGRAVRFRVPDEGSTAVVDVVRGEPVFEHRTIEDFVVVRSNGSAIFVLANVVDDMDMQISHVIRAEEHLPTTPKFVLLWQALGGGPLPVFAHLPVLVNAQRKKLSKRRPGDGVELEAYRAEGYLAQAMVNYLCLLGWAPSGDRELLTRDEMLAEFRLEDVNNSPAFFDVKKLRHFDGEYIRSLPVDEFVVRAEPFLDPEWDVETFRRLAPLVQERVFVLQEVRGMVDFLFDEPVIDPIAWQKAAVGFEPARAVIEAALTAYADCVWEAAVLHGLTEGIAEAQDLKLGKAQAPIRVAVTGRTVGPPLFEALEVLGRECVLERLRAARARLG